MDLRQTAALLGLVLALGGGAVACGSGATVEPCGRIPEGGCPLGRGGTCDDLACAGLYDCVEGAWTEVESCPGGTSTTTTGSGGGAGGGEPCEPPAIDRTGEAEGCTPDLLEPDCPVAAAEVCPDPCATGCADFFLCTDDGWIDVAACDEAGTLRVFR